MQCKVCRGDATFLWSKPILRKFQGDYYQCQSCHFVFVANPTWMAEAYQDPINIYDTGLMARNLRFANLTATFLSLFHRQAQPAAYLDYSGGYGIFVRLMRDRGFDFLWQDAYAKNLLARGFEYHGQKISFSTCFEVLEHAPDPHQLIESLKATSPVFLISTELVPDHLSPDWAYLGPEHGQHICFFHAKSIAKIAELHQLHVLTRGSLHLFSLNPIPKWKWTATAALSKFFGSKFRAATSISPESDADLIRSTTKGRS